MDEDIEMENNNIINNNNNDETNKKINNEQNEDSYSILDKIENELKLINNTFLFSLNEINFSAPFLPKGTEQNMEKTKYNNFINVPNYEEKRENNENIINDYADQMNDHFNKILDLTNKLKNFEEFNTKEEDLKEKLDKLQERNVIASNDMKKKLDKVEKILNNLNLDKSMENEINKREQFDDEVDYIENN